MSRRMVRLIVVPATLFAVVSATVFALALTSPAKDEQQTATPVSVIVDPLRGDQLFAENCARCHGDDGTGGGIGPRLAGAGVSLNDARSTIENGSGVMPAGLVEGQDLEDVLAYLETILG